MAYKYVDFTNGNDSLNTGNSMASAYKTLKKALELGTLAAGDVVLVRRNMTDTPTASIAVGTSGNASNFIRCMGWARGTLALTGIGFVKDSDRATYGVGSGVASESALAARFFTGPDGLRYQIRRVDTVNSYVYLKSTYKGTTVSNQSITLEADEDYTWMQAISSGNGNDGSWNGDAHTLPIVDYAANAYYTNFSSRLYWGIGYLHFKGGTATNGNLRLSSVRQAYLVNCLFEVTTATGYYGCYTTNTNLLMYRCWFYNANDTTYGYNVYAGGADTVAESCIFQDAKYALVTTSSGRFFGYDCHFGRESEVCSYYVHTPGACVDDNFFLYDCRFLTSTGKFFLATDYGAGAINTMYANKSLAVASQYRKQPRRYDVVMSDGSEAAANLRPGGASQILWAKWNGGSNTQGFRSPYDKMSSFRLAQRLFQHAYTLAPGTYTFKYYVNLVSSSALSVSDFWLEARSITRYVSETDFDTALTKTSSLTVTQRANADDWADYVSVQVVVAVTSVVFLDLYLCKASAELYIDPAVNIVAA